METELAMILSKVADASTIALAVLFWRFDRRLYRLELHHEIKKAG